MVLSGYPNSSEQNYDIYFDKKLNKDNIIYGAINKVENHYYNLKSRTLSVNSIILVLKWQ